MEKYIQADVRDDEDVHKSLNGVLRSQLELEAELDGRTHSFIEKHPRLLGYSCLIGLALFLATPHLIMFSLSLLFLYLMSDFITDSVRRHLPFMPRPLLFWLQYAVVIVAITIVTYNLIPELLKQLPELAGQLQVKIVNEIKVASRRYDLAQYVDIDELRSSLISGTKDLLRILMESITPIYKGFVQFIFALILNVLLFHERERIEHVFTRKPESLMFFLYRFVELRLRVFYFYFRRVMGGQLVIAAINTAISSFVIFTLGLSHPVAMVFVVLLCGIFPIVGNLVSNSVLIINAFVSVGIWASGVCLILLIMIHKLEYFLNSRIIGRIVHLPMAVTLAALIFSEVLLGIPGLILAIPLLLSIRYDFEHINVFKSSPVSFSTATESEKAPETRSKT